MEWKGGDKEPREGAQAQRKGAKSERNLSVV
jgi:hypothetical protein